MDFDFAQLRAFVTVVDERHFGRAADELALTQQGLSKRIQRLEQIVGQRLLARAGRAVELTPVGERFLPHARRLLGEMEDAVRALRPAPAPAPTLRVDVWGPAMLRVMSERMSDVPIAATLRRSLPAALQAMERGEIDAALGRVHGLEPPLAHRFEHQLVWIEHYGVGIPTDHPLAARHTVTFDDLAGYTLWFPAARDGSAELVRAFRLYADHMGTQLDSGGHYPGLGTDAAVEAARGDPRRLLLVPTQRDLAPSTGLARIALDPAPCYPWSLVWRAGETHPALPVVLQRFAEVAAAEGWLDFDRGHDWLPDTDLGTLARDLAPQG